MFHVMQCRRWAVNSKRHVAYYAIHYGKRQDQHSLHRLGPATQPPGGRRRMVLASFFFVLGQFEMCHHVVQRRTRYHGILRTAEHNYVLTLLEWWPSSSLAMPAEKLPHPCIHTRLHITLPAHGKAIIIRQDGARRKMQSVLLLQER